MKNKNIGEIISYIVLSVFAVLLLVTLTLEKLNVDLPSWLYYVLMIVFLGAFIYYGIFITIQDKKNSKKNNTTFNTDAKEDRLVNEKEDQNNAK